LLILAEWPKLSKMIKTSKIKLKIVLTLISMFLVLFFFSETCPIFQQNHFFSIFFKKSSKILEKRKKEEKTKNQIKTGAIKKLRLEQHFCGENKSNKFSGTSFHEKHSGSNKLKRFRELFQIISRREK